MLFTTLGLITVLMGILIIISLQDQLNVFRIVVLGLLLILFVLGLLLLVTILSIVMLWYNKKIPKFLMNIVSVSIPLFFPLLVMVGKGLKIEKNVVRRAYTLISNKLILAKKYSLKGENILILTPHCIQKAFCPHKITYDVENCKRCGLCHIENLLNLKDKYGIQFKVVTGGTLARKLILDIKPKAIIAIACERDLVSGLMDVKKIPVIAVINHRPEGPCINTQVDLQEVEKAICHFLKE